MKKAFLLLLILSNIKNLAQPGTVKGFTRNTDANTAAMKAHQQFGFGTSLCVIGDIDKDGIPDMATGVSDPPQYGMVYILFMKADGTVKGYSRIGKNLGGLNKEIPDWFYFQNFGQSIAALGDLDQDGIPDIAIGSGESSTYNKGEFFIIFLKSDGTVKDSKTIMYGKNGFWDELDDDPYFGFSVSCIGDVNNDGIVDLLVGAYNDVDGGYERGSAYVMFLKRDGTIKKYQKISSSKGNFTGALSNSTLFGFSTAYYTKSNNRHVVAVGAPWDQNTQNASGSIWLLSLDTNGKIKNWKKIAKGQNGFNDSFSNAVLFGYSICPMGDVDGDGTDDIAVGGPHFDDGVTGSGAVWILFMNPDLTVKGSQRISNSRGNLGFNLHKYAQFGFSVAFLGDWNKDGRNDLAVGANNDSLRGSLNLLYLNGADHTSIQPEAESKIKIYPNPSGNQLWVESQWQSAEIRIYNSLGQGVRVVQLTSGKSLVNVSDLPEGFYFVYIHSGKDCYQEKILISHSAFQ